MFVSELGRFNKLLQDGPFSDDRLFQRPLELISDTEIQLFYARAGFAGMRSQAIETIDTLQSELLLAAMEGSIPQECLRIITHEAPRSPFSMDEFIDRLVKLSQVRRLAVLMALSTKSALERIISLEWKETAQLRQLPDLASEILKARRRLQHIKLPYVFWEQSSKHVSAPLIGLERQVSAAFDGDSWPVVQMHWDNMIWIDRRSEGKSFLGIVDEVARGLL
jgi:hypothetical protein